MKIKPKVVLDTNIFIKAWYSEDKHCKRILNMVANRDIQLIFDQSTIGELMYVVKFSGRYYYENKKDVLKDLNTLSVLFYYATTPNTSEIASPLINDDTDVKFLDCGIACNADYIVSDDFKSGLHSIEDYSFRVIGSKDFIELIKNIA